MSGLLTIQTPPCPMCDKSSLIEVDAISFRTWQAGAHIQNAFPQLLAGQRELLMTGFHEACWDQMYDESKAEEAAELDDSDAD